LEPPTLSIRAFKDENEAQVVDLWHTCFPGEPSRNAPLQVIRRKRQVQPDLFLVGLIDDRVVCTALAGYDGFRGWIYHVATAPDQRRRGFGRKMVRAVERKLIQLGCPKLNLQVRSTNREVAAFYESLGYGIEDRVSMGKTLGALDYREAEQADLEFLWELHRAALGEYVDQTWSRDEEGQAGRFRDSVDLSTRSIVLLGSTPIGCIGVQHHRDHVFVEYMALLPEYQRRGFGSRMIDRVLEQAGERGVKVRLQVLRVNPVKRLCERHGFQLVGGDDHRYYLETRP
jgi:ribosomal protein S18 acetylase RimI-like enzyme